MPQRRWIGWSVVAGSQLVALLVIACGREPSTDSDFAAISMSSCGLAPALPEPMNCAGPDGSGWSNVPRATMAPPGCPGDPPSAACPAPPTGCTQVVLGRLCDTQDYVGCPGYVVLNRSDWTIGMNDNFIACAASCQIGTCDSVKIVSPDMSIPDFNTDHTMTSVTSRELCQLYNDSCVVITAAGPGEVICACHNP